ncbi:MAG TPA: hypothetical protein VKE22_00390 [Haliangiales bacterium]|nr:hypothetical protein [Haliangiales bacterium]
MRRNHLFLLWMSAIAACGSKQGEEPDGPPPAQPDGPACPAATGPTHHSASINADETWTAAGSPHLVDFSISIHAKVTIEACAEVRIASNATITVGPGGAIVGEGTADQRIAIGAIDVEQPWATIRAIGGSIRLAHATVSDGGLPPGNAVPFTWGAFMAQMGTDPRAPVAALSFDHVKIVGSRSDGIQMSVSQFDAASTDLTIVGAAEYPVRLDPSALGSLPSGSYVGNAHDEILVPGGSVVADMTIHARGVPYHIGDSVASHELRVGTTPGSPVATLTIEPNVTLRFESDGVLAVEHFTGTNPASGALVARGTAAAPIVFTSASAAPAAGDWVGITFGSAANPNDALDHVRIEYAGKVTGTIGASCPLNDAAQAALVIVGAKPASGFLTNSTIASSGKDGVYRGWIGDEVDFLSSNTFTDVPGCDETFPPAQQGVCPQNPPCPK